VPPSQTLATGRSGSRHRARGSRRRARGSCRRAYLQGERGIVRERERYIGARGEERRDLAAAVCYPWRCARERKGEERDRCGAVGRGEASEEFLWTGGRAEGEARRASASGGRSGTVTDGNRANATTVAFSSSDMWAGWTMSCSRRRQSVFPCHRSEAPHNHKLV
jgi:hypothetical protein